MCGTKNGDNEIRNNMIKRYCIKTGSQTSDDHIVLFFKGKNGYVQRNSTERDVICKPFLG
jgi:hypothetical protein